jgi:hypothetical protein
VTEVTKVTEGLSSLASVGHANSAALTEVDGSDGSEERTGLWQHPPSAGIKPTPVALGIKRPYYPERSEGYTPSGA